MRRLLACALVGLGLVAGCATGSGQPTAPTTAAGPPPATTLAGGAASPGAASRQPSPAAAASPSAPPTRAPGPAPAGATTPAVVEPHLNTPSEPQLMAVTFEKALNQGDVDGALELLAGDAQVKVPPDLYANPRQIRDWLEYLRANHFYSEPGLREVAGDRVSWPAEVTSDYLRHIGLPSLSGTATLVLKEGRIASYTFVLTRESASRHRAAQLAASQVLQDPLIVGAESANVYGFTDVFRDTEGRLLSYRDVLTADAGSGPFYDLGGQVIMTRTGF